MPTKFKKTGFVGVMVAGLVFITGCVEPAGPVPEAVPVHTSIYKSSAQSSDSSAAGVSINRTGTCTVTATFNSSGR